MIPLWFVIKLAVNLVSSLIRQPLNYKRMKLIFFYFVMLPLFRDENKSFCSKVFIHTRTQTILRRLLISKSIEPKFGKIFVYKQISLIQIHAHSQFAQRIYYYLETLRKKSMRFIMKNPSLIKLVLQIVTTKRER